MAAADWARGVAFDQPAVPRLLGVEVRPVPTQRSRRVAFDALRRVNGEGAYANLGAARPAHRAPDQRPRRRLRHRTAGGHLPRPGQLRPDHRRSSQPVAVKPAAGGADLLRLGTYQILAMRVPAHAAVAATVDLAAATVGQRVTGLVNAVLRRVSAHDLDTWLTPVG